MLLLWGKKGRRWFVLNSTTLLLLSLGRLLIQNFPLCITFRSEMEVYSVFGQVGKINFLFADICHSLLWHKVPSGKESAFPSSSGHWCSKRANPIYESDISSFMDGWEEDRTKLDLNFSTYLREAKPARTSTVESLWWSEVCLSGRCWFPCLRGTSRGT